MFVLPRLFAEGTIPAAFTIYESKTSPHGVIVAYYKRAGEVKTGSFWKKKHMVGILGLASKIKQSSDLGPITVHY